MLRESLDYLNERKQWTAPVRGQVLIEKSYELMQIPHAYSIYATETAKIAWIV